MNKYYSFKTLVSTFSFLEKKWIWRETRALTAISKSKSNLFCKLRFTKECKDNWVHNGVASRAI